MSRDTPSFKASSAEIHWVSGAYDGAAAEKAGVRISRGSAFYAQPPSSSRTVKILLVALSLVTSGYVFYDSLALRSHQAFSDSYALCSREGAQIYTVDPENPRAQCLTVRGDTFVSTGSLEHILSHWQETSTRPLQVRYLEPGQIVVPGMSDSHTHVLEYGEKKQIPLEDTSSIEETVSRVREYILSDPEILNDKSKWIEGWGWDHTRWILEQWPTSLAFDADPIVAGRPVMLRSKDGHAYWVSNVVMQAMEPIPDEVEGGVIMRDSSGNPTGVFLDIAGDLVTAVQPPPTFSTMKKHLDVTVKDAHSVGLTSVHDAFLNPLPLEFFRREALAGSLPIRVYGMKYFDETAPYWGDSFEKIIRAGNNRLTVRSVKMIGDGALRSGGAALYEPYTDNPETCGFMRVSPEILNEYIPKFMADGWQVNVHAIGDRANGVVLDAFEAALASANVTALRPRLEHAQILAPKDMARFGDLGVIASVQPTHAISDMWFGEARLGPERVKGLYAFRSIMENGARITLGSDFPVEDMNPLAGFYAAITRVSRDGTSPHGPGGWFPEQRMTREEALKGMTLDPAYASFSEDILGSITPGKLADFVVLSKDIMKVPPMDLLTTRVVATVIDGKPVYGAL
ncbi:amidohydrolase family-domain-containing protein [Cerioporus squamosus]|nr:amidohydrolase family-domain-containing protein [Cerioporus squamosus]